MHLDAGKSRIFRNLRRLHYRFYLGFNLFRSQLRRQLFRVTEDADSRRRRQPGIVAPQSHRNLRENFCAVSPRAFVELVRGDFEGVGVAQYRRPDAGVRIHCFVGGHSSREYQGEAALRAFREILYRLVFKSAAGEVVLSSAYRSHAESVFQRKFPDFERRPKMLVLSHSVASFLPVAEFFSVTL